jgi:hypothetical protein
LVLELSLVLFVSKTRLGFVHVADVDVAAAAAVVDNVVALVLLQKLPNSDVMIETSFQLMTTSVHID